MPVKGTCLPQAFSGIAPPAEDTQCAHFTAHGCSVVSRVFPVLGIMLLWHFDSLSRSLIRWRAHRGRLDWVHFWFPLSCAAPSASHPLPQGYKPPTSHTALAPLPQIIQVIPPSRVGPPCATWEGVHRGFPSLPVLRRHLVPVLCRLPWRVPAIP